jgi:hypothetical protein
LAHVDSRRIEVLHASVSLAVQDPRGVGKSSPSR